MRRIWKGAAAACIAIALTTGCGHGSERRESTEQSSGLPGLETTKESKEIAQDEVSEEVYRRIRDINFSIYENPVDKERYDSQTDRVYKDAFRKAVTNQITIYDRYKKEAVYYQDFLQEAGEMSEEELLKYIRQSDFYYQDFDGDGLPELTVNTEGPCVLKYNAEEDRVELYYRKGPGWNLLGTGQMFYYSDYSDNLSDEGQSCKYGYEIVDCGQVKQSVALYSIMYPDDISGWIDTYKVSLDGYKEFEVEEEEGEKLIADYFEVKYLAPHPMTFSAVFGDETSDGYYPGSIPKQRYLLDDRDYLPLNEETGEEWEAYKTMMSGDFSLVEDEQWVSLQNRYESDLEAGNGTCSWSYFLMDFDQDGFKELCIRYYTEVVNNTAFFRYENGHIKMWGSYGSGDSHGYEKPLRNGKMMSVYWYQDDKIRWINRLDSDFYYNRERSYTSGIRNVEGSDFPNDLKEAEKKPFYSFQDYYSDGQLCGESVSLSEEEWMQIEDMIEDLMIPETAWQPCSVFTPASDRPAIPGEG